MQARENLYFKKYGVQHVTPVVIMTSHAKKNHEMVVSLLESYNWFGRSKEMFRCAPNDTVKPHIRSVVLDELVSQ